MFVPHSLAVPDADRPRVAYLLHGILGNHGNWRSFARQLAESLPDWRFHLVDLRNHGESGSPPPPHTLAAVADDLAALATRTGPPEVVIGHSYGGKVALQIAAQRPAGLRQVWVLDSTPQAWEHPPGDDNEVLSVLGALREVPMPLARRQDVMGALAALGMSPMIQRWMTTNLTRQEDGTYVWSFDLDAAQAMLDDYFAQDLWGPLETTDPSAPSVHLVRAGRSDRWDEETLGRLARLAPPAAGTLHLLPESGHWVHVDAPDALRALLIANWPG